MRDNTYFLAKYLNILHLLFYFFDDSLDHVGESLGIKRSLDLLLQELGDMDGFVGYHSRDGAVFREFDLEMVVSVNS